MKAKGVNFTLDEVSGGDHGYARLGNINDKEAMAKNTFLKNINSAGTATVTVGGLGQNPCPQGYTSINPSTFNFNNLNAGGFILPVQGGVFTACYGKEMPYSPCVAHGGRPKGHNGLDIAMDIGTPIVASKDGAVTKAGWDEGGYGFLVVIQHGQDCSFYGHNSALSVTVGQQVKQGQKIASMGSTGFSSGSHTHFGISIGTCDYYGHGGSVNPCTAAPGCPPGEFMTQR